MTHVPSSDIELFSDEAIRSPEPLWKVLRAIGPVVWMDRYKMWAITRYDEVKEVLGDWRRFTTSKGVAMDDKVNAATSGPGKANSLTSDPPLHDDIRKITGIPLMPGRLREMEPIIRNNLEVHFAELCERKEIDAIEDLAKFIPMTMVRDFVGLPKEGQERMLAWAAATFDAMGPMNDRCKAAIPIIQEQHKYCIEEAIPPNLKKDGWADKIYQAADEGKIEPNQCPGMMREYINPALDTTILGMGHLLRQISLHPDQWQLLKKKPELVPSAVNEALRLNSPINSFTRYVNEDTTVGGVDLTSGDRLIVLYGSANRCEQKWDDPEVFNIERNVRDHVAFGFGIHSCGGMHLARLEMKVLLEVLLDKAESFTTEEPEVFMNNTLKGFSSMPMTITPRST